MSGSQWNGYWETHHIEARFPFLLRGDTIIMCLLDTRMCHNSSFTHQLLCERQFITFWGTSAGILSLCQKVKGNSSPSCITRVRQSILDTLQTIKLTAEYIVSYCPVPTTIWETITFYCIGVDNRSIVSLLYGPIYGPIWSAKEFKSAFSQAVFFHLAFYICLNIFICINICISISICMNVKRL